MHSNLMKEPKNKQVPNIEDCFQVLHAYCRFLTKSPWDGDDIAQEAVLKVIEKYGHQPDQLTPALLKKVAYHHWIDTVRKRERETFEMPVEPSEMFFGNSSEEVLDVVQYLIKYFTPKQAIILLLKEAFQYRSSEIADILGTTEMAIKSILHRSKKRIEKKLGSCNEVIWEKNDKQLLTELAVDALTHQDPTKLIHSIPNIHSLMKESIIPFPSKAHSPSSGLCMAA